MGGKQVKAGSLCLFVRTVRFIQHLFKLSTGAVTYAITYWSGPHQAFSVQAVLADLMVR